MKVCIRAFNLPVYGEVDGKWQRTKETRLDEYYDTSGEFEESDIDAVRQCIYCLAVGDDLYETDLNEALAHTEVVEVPLCERTDKKNFTVGVVHKEREIFDGDDDLPKRWMVGRD